LEVLLARAGEPEARYVTNENPLIEQAFTHVEKLLKQISKLTQTPSLVEDEKGGVESAESLKVRMMPLLKKVRFFELIYDPAIKAILRIAGRSRGTRPIRRLSASYSTAVCRRIGNLTAPSGAMHWRMASPRKRRPSAGSRASRARNSKRS